MSTRVNMIWQWLNAFLAWFTYYIRPHSRLNNVFNTGKVSPLDTFQCNRRIKSRAWRIPQLCNYIHERYGKLAELRLLGQRVLIVTDLEIATSLMTNHGHSLKQRFGNQFGLQNLNMYLTGLIWNNDVQQWKHNRNVFESTLKLGSRNLEDLALCHLETVDRTTLKIAEPVTVLELLRNFTLSMTMEGLFEIPMPNDAHTYEWREEAKTTVANYFKAWEFFLLNPNSHNLTDSELHHDACFKMLQLSREIFAKSVEIGNSAFISNLSHCNDNNGITQCIAEMLLAGTDTSSITMFYTLLFLADFPETANKVSRIIHSETPGTVDKEIANLYYESMRLIPVGPVILRQCEADIEEQQDVVSLKKGDGIIFNIACMNRANYDRSDQFDPSRYATEKFPLSFGVGKKSCVGKTFAEREMKIFFAWFLKKYSVLGHADEMVGLLKTRWDVANAPVHDIKLTIFPRKLVYFVGHRRTGKTQILDAIGATYPKMKIIRQEQILLNHLNKHSIQHDLAFCDLQFELINAHTKLMNSLKSELVLIEGSMLDCFVNLKRRVLSHGYNENELLRPMKNCLVVYFPIFDENCNGKPQVNKDYLDMLDRIDGCRYHCLDTRFESDRYTEIMNFIGSCRDS